MDVTVYYHTFESHSGRGKNLPLSLGILIKSSAFVPLFPLFPSAAVLIVRKRKMTKDSSADPSNRLLLSTICSQQAVNQAP
jgi:hypothetical protein